ncbi:hypothetical protein NC652_031418 [Populus alba x Populus x berolinensis]|nr:hypothetical protein NC652_031418 [Populus alba x Populus x berolinensis]
MVMLASSAGSLVLKRVKPVCWSGSDVEWQWLLDEEDDELKMALAVLVRLSSFCPFFFVRLPLSARDGLVLVSGNGRLVI